MKRKRNERKEKENKTRKKIHRGSGLTHLQELEGGQQLPRVIHTPEEIMPLEMRPLVRVLA